MPRVNPRLGTRPGGGYRTGIPEPHQVPDWVRGASAFMQFDPKEVGDPSQQRMIEGGLATYEIPIRNFSGDIALSNPGATAITVVVPLLRNTVSMRFQNLVGTVLASMNGCPWATVFNGDSYQGVQLASVVLVMGPASSVLVQLTGT